MTPDPPASTGSAITGCVLMSFVAGLLVGAFLAGVVLVARWLT